MTECACQKWVWYQTRHQESWSRWRSEFRWTGTLHTVAVDWLSLTIPLHLGKNEEHLCTAATTDMFSRFTSPEPENVHQKLLSGWGLWKWAINPNLIGSDEPKDHCCCCVSQKLWKSLNRGFYFETWHSLRSTTLRLVKYITGYREVEFSKFDTSQPTKSTVGSSPPKKQRQRGDKPCHHETSLLKSYGHKNLTLASDLYRLWDLFAFLQLSL